MDRSLSFYQPFLHFLSSGGPQHASQQHFPLEQRHCDCRYWQRSSPQLVHGLLVKVCGPPLRVHLWHGDVVAVHGPVTLLLSGLHGVSCFLVPACRAE